MLDSRYRRTPILILWAVLLSALTAVFGAAPLRVLRSSLGSSLYWIVGVAIVGLCLSFKWPALAAVFAAQVILVGVFAEFEERDLNLKTSSLLAVTLTSVLAFSLFYLWTAIVGKGWLATLVGAVTPVVDQAKAMKLGVFAELKPQDLISQLPSATVIFLIVSLALALLFEKRLSRWAQVRPSRKEKLTDFSAPDFFIWCLIASLLGAFGKVGPRAVEFAALNLFNVTAVVYFFQGLAVLGKYFETFHIGLVWRLMWVFLLVVQLPILMSLVGAVDYWVEFRKMFVKRAAEIKKKSIQD